MSIASLVLRIRPETRPQAEAALLAFPGVECHGMSEDGRLIVTVEDAPQAAMSDTLIAIHRVPQVLVRANWTTIDGVNYARTDAP